MLELVWSVWSVWSVYVCAVVRLCFLCVYTHYTKQPFGPMSWFVFACLSLLPCCTGEGWGAVRGGGRGAASPGPTLCPVAAGLAQCAAVPDAGVPGHVQEAYTAEPGCLHRWVLARSLLSVGRYTCRAPNCFVRNPAKPIDAPVKTSVRSRHGGVCIGAGGRGGGRGGG